jgi:aminoglycoside phosphotransferase (APT) family kinase protein
MKRVWDRTKTRELPVIDELHAQMLTKLPTQTHTGLVHGDFRLGNVMLRNSEVVAVLDWELCSLGDVLMDLAALLNNWQEPDDPATNVWMESPPSTSGGFLSRDAMVTRYIERTGFDVTEVDFYRALNFWRIAILAEGIKRRYMNDAMDGQVADLEELETRIRNRAALAEQFMARGLHSGS